jgi:hypothetical protein
MFQVSVFAFASQEGGSLSSNSVALWGSVVFLKKEDEPRRGPESFSSYSRRIGILRDAGL